MKPLDAIFCFFSDGIFDPGFLTAPRSRRPPRATTQLRKAGRIDPVRIV